MDTIKPLHRLTPEEVRALAHAAADRDDDTNPFPAMTERYDLFKTDYSHRHDELSPA